MLADGEYRDVRDIEKMAAADGHHWDTVKKASERLSIDKRRKETDGVRRINWPWEWRLLEEQPVRMLHVV